MAKQITEEVGLDNSGERWKRVKRRKQLLWKLLFALFLVGGVGSLMAWGVLLTTICSTPHAHMQDTQHTIPYSCHGMTVFISTFEESLRQWLIPAGALLTAFSVIAGVMVALSTGKIKIKVEIHVEDSAQDEPHHRSRE